MGFPQTAFEQWIGESAVVDARGDPLVVYHGTGADVATFKPSLSGWYGKGIYFTDDPGLAEEYAFDAGENANVMPVYLRITNPYLYAEPWFNGEDEANFDLIKEVLPSEKARHLIEKMRREQTGKVGSELQDELVVRGYDGIIVESSSSPGAREFIVFSPTQIKSALGNFHTFDPQQTSMQDNHQTCRSRP